MEANRDLEVSRTVKTSLIAWYVCTQSSSPTTCAANYHRVKHLYADIRCEFSVILQRRRKRLSHEIKRCIGTWWQRKESLLEQSRQLRGKYLARNAGKGMTWTIWVSHLHLFLLLLTLLPSFCFYLQILSLISYSFSWHFNFLTSLLLLRLNGSTDCRAWTTTGTHKRLYGLERI
jgi:hypothetical protein